MKTEDLIAGLAAAGPAQAPLDLRGIGLRMAAAAGLAAGLFLALAGVRAGLGAALSQPLILAKTLLPGALAALALPAALRLMRPGARIGRATVLGFGLIAVLAAGLWVISYLGRAPEVRFAGVSGFSVGECMGLIVAIAALPAAFALRLMRAGAATRPRLAGAVAGLAVGALATTGYSFFCTQDNPLFYLSFYGAAIAIVSAAGAALGGRWLAF